MGWPKGKPSGRKTGGRGAGVPNVITTDLKAIILEALHLSRGEGPDGKPTIGAIPYLRMQSRVNPVAFMALVGKVLPLQLTGANGGPIVVSWNADDTMTLSSPNGKPLVIEHSDADRKA